MATHIISIENCHLYGDVLPQMLRLRHKEFKVRQDYDVPSFKEMEYDTYDTPAAVYVLYQDDKGIIRGCSRMAPTDRAYMIKEIWPNIITTMPLPNSPSIWESTRFAIDSSLPANERQTVKLSILQAKMEYCLHEKVEGMIGVMPTLIWRAVFSNSGWPVRLIGEVITLPSKEKIAPAWIPVEESILQNIMDKRGTKELLIPLINPKKKEIA